MSTNNSTDGYGHVVAVRQDLLKSLEGDDAMTNMAAQTKAVGKHAVRQHASDLSSIGHTAGGKLFRIHRLDVAAKELSPSQINHFGPAVHNHDDVESAIASLPAHARSGDVGVHVRAFFKPASAGGHDLPRELQAQLDSILEAAHASGTGSITPTATGSAAKGSGGKDTGSVPNSGIDPGSSSKGLHTGPAPSKAAPPKFADWKTASNKLRDQLQGDK
jgi:hypothetical protein